MGDTTEPIMPGSPGGNSDNTPQQPAGYPGATQPYLPYPPVPQQGAHPAYPAYPPVARAQGYTMYPPVPQPGARSAGARPQGAQQARMPKDQANQVVRALRAWIAAGSVIAFGALAVLVASHVTGVTASGSSNTNTPATSPSQNTIQPSGNEDDGGGFFSQNQGGFGVGSGNFGQAPVTSSSSS